MVLLQYYQQLAASTVPPYENKQKPNQKHSDSKTTTRETKPYNLSFVIRHQSSEIDTKAANLVTDYIFDKDRGFMTDIINNSLSKNIWYNYSYDALGNLKKRADIKDINNSNIGLSECFYYDGLNRMTATRRYANFGVNRIC